MGSGCAGGASARRALGRVAWAGIVKASPLEEPGHDATRTVPLRDDPSLSADLAGLQDSLPEVLLRRPPSRRRGEPAGREEEGGADGPVGSGGPAAVAG